MLGGCPGQEIPLPPPPQPPQPPPQQQQPWSRLGLQPPPPPPTPPTRRQIASAFWLYEAFVEQSAANWAGDGFEGVWVQTRAVAQIVAAAAPRLARHLRRIDESRSPELADAQPLACLFQAAACDTVHFVCRVRGRAPCAAHAARACHLMHEAVWALSTAACDAPCQSGVAQPPLPAARESTGATHHLLPHAPCHTAAPHRCCIPLLRTMHTAAAHHARCRAPGGAAAPQAGDGELRAGVPRVGGLLGGGRRLPSQGARGARALAAGMGTWCTDLTTPYPVSTPAQVSQ